jgi:translation initiation factor 3 subunit A
MQVVVDYLRSRSEERVHDALRDGSKSLDVMDLESEELPESLLMASVQGSNPARQQTSDLINGLRFLWEAYKLILDLLKVNGKMLETYKDVALRAFEFCKIHKRKPECKRLCEMLRNHLMMLIRGARQGMLTGGFHIKMDDDSTISTLMDIRNRQIEVCMDLELWQEAFKSAEDYFQLLSIRGEKNTKQTLAKYWRKLATIFWHSGFNLYHAYAWLLYTSSYRTYSNAPNKKEEDQKYSSITVLAILSVPNYNLADNVVKTSAEDESLHEIHNKLANMCRSTGSVTREQLINSCIMSNIVECAIPEVKKLFYLLEHEFSPLTLSEQVKEVLDKISENEVLKQYIPSLEQVLVGKVLAQLSKCYSNIQIKTFQKLLHFINLKRCEKYMVDISQNTSLKIVIDYANDSINFKETQQISKVSNKLAKLQGFLQQCANVINKKKIQEAKLAEHKESFKQVNLLIKEEQQKLADKTQESREQKLKRDKEEIKLAEELRAAEEQEKREKEIEEKQRQKNREIQKKLERIEHEKNQIVLDEISTWISKMRSSGFSAKDMKIKGKLIDEMTEEEILEVGYEEFIKHYNRVFERINKEREIMLKKEQQTFEHTERARREAIIPILMKQWENTSEEEVQHKRRLHKAKFDKDLELKNTFAHFVDAKNQYVQDETKRLKTVFDPIYEAWKENMKTYYKERVLEFARAEREEEKKRQEERKAEERERQKRLAERRFEPRGRREEDTGFIRKGFERRDERAEPTTGWRRANVAPAETPKPTPVAEKPAEAPRKLFTNKKKVEQTEEPKPVEKKPEPEKVPERQVEKPVEEAKAPVRPTPAWRKQTTEEPRTERAPEKAPEPARTGTFGSRTSRFTNSKLPQAQGKDLSKRSTPEVSKQKPKEEAKPDEEGFVAVTASKKGKHFK